VDARENPGGIILRVAEVRQREEDDARSFQTFEDLFYDAESFVEGVLKFASTKSVLVKFDLIRPRYYEGPQFILNLDADLASTRSQRCTELGRRNLHHVLDDEEANGLIWGRILDQDRDQRGARRGQHLAFVDVPARPDQRFEDSVALGKGAEAGQLGKRESKGVERRRITLAQCDAGGEDRPTDLRRASSTSPAFPTSSATRAAAARPTPRAAAAEPASATAGAN
jgi:hypothetical protein